MIWVRKNVSFLLLKAEKHMYYVHCICILPPCLFNLYAVYIMRNTGLDEAQAGIKIARRNINKLRYADNTTLMAESKELKASWWKWKSRVKKLA